MICNILNESKSDRTVFISKVYPIISKSLDKNYNKYINYIKKFLSYRYEHLHDQLPCNRLYFTNDDYNDFFNILEINKNDITNEMSNLYYWNIPFNPPCAKDELTMCVLCTIKYLSVKNKPSKDLGLVMLYLTLTGKIYPSLHYRSFPKSLDKYRHIMEYVVNNELNMSFDLKKFGNLHGVLLDKTKIWYDGYKSNKFKSFDDEDCVYLIQQIRDRIGAFIITIASLYYEAFEQKKYISYDSDLIDDNNYRITDSNSLKVERYSEKAMDDLINKGINFKFAKLASSTTIRVDELTSILETILLNKANIPVIKELVSLLINEYLYTSPNGSVTDIDFIAYTIKPKPNTKNKNIIRSNEIIENWLDENSPSYRKRKSRLATKLAYNKGVLFYITLIIQNSNK